MMNEREVDAPRLMGHFWLNPPRASTPGALLNAACRVVPPMPGKHEVIGFREAELGCVRPLVNGYSGYYPQDYVWTMVRMESFSDDGSMARLRAHDVRHIVVHRAFFEPERYTVLLLRMASQPDPRPWGTYKDAMDDAALFVLER